MDWRDFNRDCKVDAAEEMFAMEMICGSGEEHEALFEIWKNKPVIHKSYYDKAA